MLGPPFAPGCCLARKPSRLSHDAETSTREIAAGNQRPMNSVWFSIPTRA